MKNEKQFFVAEEDGIYNAFSIDMFNEKGYLEGYDGEIGYRLEDYDVIKWFSDWNSACDFSDKMNDEL